MYILSRRLYYNVYKSKKTRARARAHVYTLSIFLSLYLSLSYSLILTLSLSHFDLFLTRPRPRMRALACAACTKRSARVYYYSRRACESFWFNERAARDLRGRFSRFSSLSRRRPRSVLIGSSVYRVSRQRQKERERELSSLFVAVNRKTHGGRTLYVLQALSHLSWFPSFFLCFLG